MWAELEREIDRLCLAQDDRRTLKTRLSALWQELTKDDAPVFRAALGEFRRIGP